MDKNDGAASLVRSHALLAALVVNSYREPLKRLGVPQNYPFLSSGYCEELCIYIRILKERAEANSVNNTTSKKA